MIVEMSVMPVGTGTQTHDMILPLLDEIRASGLRHETHAMGTNIEGEWDEVMDLVRRCMNRLYARGVERLAVSLQISERRDGPPNTLARRREIIERGGVAHEGL